MNVAAVILAGGRGTRFWPLSRKARPKQVIDVTGEGSLLALTLARLNGMVPAGRRFVVTGPDMVEAVRPEATGAQLLVEPSGRNTLPAIAWGAWAAEKAGADTVIVLPSDHAVRDAGALRAALSLAVEAAQGGALVTLGVRPTRAETGFGWIEPGDGGRVARFVEKPSQVVADALFAGGKHLWNAGMFVFRVDALRAALAEQCAGAAAALGSLDGGADVASVWERMEATSLDYGVLERHRDVRVVALDCGWSDVGSWPALDEVLPAFPWGTGVAAEVVDVDARRNLVHAEGKLVALVGVEDLIVVDTGDALLVARREDAQRVREVLTTLDARGRSRYT